MSGPDLEMLEAYFRLMNTNGVAQVYHTALNAGVLTALSNGPRSCAELSTACEIQSRPTALLLEALVAMGVVKKDSETYALTAVAQMLLGSEYRELGNPYWRHLPEFLHSGEPLKRMDDVDKSEAYYQSQAAILGWMLTPAAETAAKALGEKLNGASVSILDVGAGSAVWSLNLARLHNDPQVTAVDWPAVLEVAQETAENFGLTDCLTTIAGNCHEVDLPADEFDVALVANLTHLQTPDENEALFRRIHAALKPHGMLAIIDAFAGSPAGDVPFALYHLGLALRTENGRVYTQDELTSMLDESHFTLGEFVPLDAPPYVVGMLLCRRRDRA